MWLYFEIVLLMKFGVRDVFLSVISANDLQNLVYVKRSSDNHVNNVNVNSSLHNHVNMHRSLGNHVIHCGYMVI